MLLFLLGFIIGVVAIRLIQETVKANARYKDRAQLRFEAAVREEAHRREVQRLLDTDPFLNDPAPGHDGNVRLVRAGWDDADPFGDL